MCPPQTDNIGWRMETFWPFLYIFNSFGYLNYPSSHSFSLKLSSNLCIHANAEHSAPLHYMCISEGVTFIFTSSAHFTEVLNPALASRRPAAAVLHEWWINKLKDTPLARDHGATEASFCNNSFMQQHNIISITIMSLKSGRKWRFYQKKRSKNTLLLSMHNCMVHFAKQRWWPGLGWQWSELSNKNGIGP